MYIFTQPLPGQAESRLGENLHCKSPPFFTKWCDPLDLSKQKKLLDLGYIYPIGVRGGAALFFGWKSVFTKHPSVCGVTLVYFHVNLALCVQELILPALLTLVHPHQPPPRPSNRKPWRPSRHRLLSRDFWSRDSSTDVTPSLITTPSASLAIAFLQEVWSSG